MKKKNIKIKIILVVILVILTITAYFSRNWLTYVFHKNPFEIIKFEEVNPYALLYKVEFEKGYFNNDEYEDVLIINTDHCEDSLPLKLYILPGGEEGMGEISELNFTFDKNENYYFPNTKRTIGDLNNDGITDIVFNDRFNFLLLLSNEGKFQLVKHSFGENFLVRDVKIADIDNDKQQELVLLDFYAFISYTISGDSLIKKEAILALNDWGENNKGRREQLRYLKEKYDIEESSVVNLNKRISLYTDFGIADIDKDNDLDIILRLNEINNSEFIILKNDGTGIFKISSSLLTIGNSINTENCFMVSDLRGSTPEIILLSYLIAENKQLGLLSLFNESDSYQPSPSYIWEKVSYQEINMLEGNFRNRNEKELLIYSKNDFFIYRSADDVFQYSNKDNLDFDGTIANGVACDFDNNGVDDIVFLVHGRLARKDELGYYLFKYSKEFIKDKTQ